MSNEAEILVELPIDPTKHAIWVPLVTGPSQIDISLARSDADDDLIGNSQRFFTGEKHFPVLVEREKFHGEFLRRTVWHGTE